MIDEEFIINHLENRIKVLKEKQKEIIEKGQMESSFWFTSGLLSGLEEALELCNIQ
jgi:hypothetical protein